MYISYKQVKEVVKFFYYNLCLSFGQVCIQHWGLSWTWENGIIWNGYENGKSELSDVRHD